MKRALLDAVLQYDMAYFDREGCTGATALDVTSSSPSTRLFGSADHAGETMYLLLVANIDCGDSIIRSGRLLKLLSENVNTIQNGLAQHTGNSFQYFSTAAVSFGLGGSRPIPMPALLPTSKVSEHHLLFLPVVSVQQGAQINCLLSALQLSGRLGM